MNILLTKQNPWIYVDRIDLVISLDLMDWNYLRSTTALRAPAAHGYSSKIYLRFLSGHVFGGGLAGQGEPPLWIIMFCTH